MEPHIRPLEADDADALGRLFHRLSPETVYRRFHQPVRRPRPQVLAYLAAVDHDRREAMAAEVDGEIVGVARYDRIGDTDTAEFAIVVEDAWQRRGLGRRLAEELAAAGRRRGIRAFAASLLGDNHAALSLLRSLAPGTRVRPDHGELVARVPLTA